MENIDNITFNKDNDFFKKYLRIIKDEKKYKSSYLSIRRFVEVTTKHTLRVQKDTILYNLILPDALIDVDIPTREYKRIHKIYLMSIYEIFTPYIINYLKHHQNTYKTNVLNDYDEQELINFFNDIIKEKLINYNINYSDGIKSTYFNAIHKALVSKIPTLILNKRNIEIILNSIKVCKIS